MLLTNLILYATLLACGGVAAWVARRYDLYDYEPFRFLLLAAVLGAATMHAAGHVERWVINELTERGHAITDNEFAILAGGVEEIAKVFSVLIIAIFVRKHFNDPLDGFVFGSFVGLGAAIEESIAVLRDSEATRYLPPQEPIRIAGHLIMGGIGSFGLGLLTAPRSRLTRAFIAVPLCFLFAFALHAAWDASAFRAALSFRTISRLELRDTLAPVSLMIVGLIAYRLLAAWGAAESRFKGQFCDARTKKCPPPLS